MKTGEAALAGRGEKKIIMDAKATLGCNNNALYQGTDEGNHPVARQSIRRCQQLTSTLFPPASLSRSPSKMHVGFFPPALETGLFRVAAMI